MSEEPKTTLTDGSPVTPDHKEIDPVTGKQRDYVVLSQEERDKGFVRPVRKSYRHMGPPKPKYPQRLLTDVEMVLHKGSNYVKYEEYPKDSGPLGMYWTQRQLDRAMAGGCEKVTIMVQPIAETYARTPGFYSTTYCVGCRDHFPVGAYGEFVWDGTRERVGT